MHSARLLLYWLWYVFVAGVRPGSGYFLSRATCLGPHARELQSHPHDCARFVQCAHGRAYVHRCPPRLHWNARAQLCDYPDRAQCVRSSSSSRPPATPAAKLLTTMTTSAPAASTTCIAGWYYQHELDCAQFYYCQQGVPVRFACANGLHWNPQLQRCDDPYNVRCVLGLPVALEDGGVAVHPACPHFDEPQRTLYLPHPRDCKRFLACSNGRTWIFDCPWGLQWSTRHGRCEHAFLARCTIEADAGSPMTQKISLSVGNSVEVDSLASNDDYTDITFAVNPPSTAMEETSSTTPPIAYPSSTSPAILSESADSIRLATQSELIAPIAPPATQSTAMEVGNSVPEITQIAAIENETKAPAAINEAETITPLSIRDSMNENKNYMSTEAPPSRDREAVTEMGVSTMEATSMTPTMAVTNALPDIAPDGLQISSESAAATTSIGNSNLDFSDVTPKTLDKTPETAITTSSISEISEVGEPVFNDYDDARTTTTEFTIKVFEGMATPNDNEQVEIGDSDDWTGTVEPNANVYYGDLIDSDEQSRREKANDVSTLTTTLGASTDDGDSNAAAKLEEQQRIEETADVMTGSEALDTISDDGDLVGSVNINEQSKQEAASGVLTGTATPDANTDDRDLNAAANLEEQPRIEETADVLPGSEMLYTNADNGDLDVSVTTDEKLTNEEANNFFTETETPNASADDGDLIPSAAENTLVRYDRNEIDSLNIPSTLMDNSISKSPLDCSADTQCERETPVLYETEKRPAEVKGSLHLQGITTSTTAQPPLDPRLPFRAPQCRDPGTRSKFAAADCEQYYQCFEGYAYLLNCFEGFAFNAPDGRCTLKHLVDCMPSE